MWNAGLGEAQAGIKIAERNINNLRYADNTRREWQTTSVSCLENPMNSMKRQKDRTLNDELPSSVATQYATGDQWRNNSRKNEKMES